MRLKKKLRSISILLVLSLLSLRPIDAKAQITEEDDVILEQSAQAPYRGVLVSEPRYKFYQKKVYESDELMKFASEPQVIIKSTSTLDHLRTFTMGLFFGGLGVTYILNKK